MNKKGVTLVELSVVLVIIAITAALTIPSIGRWLPGYRLRGATRDIVSTMRTAQVKAVASNTEYRVQFDIAKGEYTLKPTAAAEPELTQKLPNNVQFKDVNFGGGVTYAVFNSNSTSSSGNVTLQNTRGAERKIVLLANTGRVRIEGN